MFRDDEEIFPVARGIIFVEAKSVIFASVSVLGSVRGSVRGSASEREAKLRVFCKDVESVGDAEATFPVGSAVGIMPVVVEREMVSISVDARGSTFVAEDGISVVERGAASVSEDEVRGFAVRESVAVDDGIIISVDAARLEEATLSKTISSVVELIVRDREMIDVAYFNTC